MTSKVRNILFNNFMGVTPGKCRMPNAEIRTAATARQRGERKSEIRGPNYALNQSVQSSDFALRASFGLRTLDFGFLSSFVIPSVNPASAFSQPHSRTQTNGY